MFIVSRSNGLHLPHDNPKNCTMQLLLENECERKSNNREYQGLSKGHFLPGTISSVLLPGG